MYTPVIAGERSAYRSTPPEATASRTISEGEDRPRAKWEAGAAAPGLPGGASSRRRHRVLGGAVEHRFSLAGKHHRGVLRYARRYRPGPPRQRSFAERVPSVRPCRSSSQLIQTGGYNEHMKTRWTAVLSAVFVVSLTDGLSAQEKHRGPVCPVAPPPASFTGIGRLARPDCRRLLPPLLRHHRRNTPRRRFSLGVRAPLLDGLHPRGFHPLRRGGDLFQLPQHARSSSFAGNDELAGVLGLHEMARSAARLNFPRRSFFIWND